MVLVHHRWECAEDLKGPSVLVPWGRAERVRPRPGDSQPHCGQSPLSNTHLAFANRACTSPIVSCGCIISRKACSPSSDLIRSKESRGGDDSGDFWLLWAQKLSVPQLNPWVLTSPLGPLGPHLSRSATKAGVSTTISGTGAGKE